ncbi:nitroreductase family protein [Chloroflexota bacterium]
MNYEGLLELVQKRRSIRKFKPEPIPDEYVNQIIEAARWAPSGANSQPWEFIVVKKQDLRDKIIELIEEERPISHKMETAREPEFRFRWRPAGYVRAPVFIILCGDTRTKDVYPVSTTMIMGSSIFTSSLASAFLYMNLAVTALGLGSQWVTAAAHPFEQSMIKELLGIPKELEIYDMMALGYPAAEPRPRLVRAREEMVHYDGYDKSKSRTEQQVKDFIVTLRSR